MAADGPALRLRDVLVIGAGRVDVRVRGGLVVAVGPAGDPALAPADEVVVDGAGAALLPGLHDHHCHLLAAAAARTSVACGPPAVHDEAELSRRLHATRPTGGWIRGVGYDEAVAGDLDAATLDRLGPPVPIRVQHRSGALWVVNTPAIAELGLDASRMEGVERDGQGRPTGRLWRLDGWLRERWRAKGPDSGPDSGPDTGADTAPDIGALSEALSAYGITGVTDATPDLSAGAVRLLQASGLRQRLVSLGVDHGVAGVGLGPYKIVVADHDLPSYDELSHRIAVARPRPVAVHCVSAAALILTLAVLGEVGSTAGDRIEHAAVTPPEIRDRLAELGLTVVTQPALVAARGDGYLDRVDPAERALLWPFRSLLDAGVRVGCSSDAPYGDLDPWSAVAAATTRRAPSGREVAGSERVSAWVALRGYLTPADDPGGPERSVSVGAPADLALLDRSLDDALADPAAVRVRATLIDGEIVPAGAA